jgi:phosphatidylserine decarboxylase
MLANILSLVHPEGWRFVGIFAGITLVFSLISPFLTWVWFILTGWCLYFFRDPKRYVPQREGLVLSPADGKVVLIQEITPPEEFGMGTEPLTRISVFLNVFNVHVNRAPASGNIRKMIYHPGKFLNAASDKASQENERSSMVITMNDGQEIAVVQIAGLIARRIVTEVTQGDPIRGGQRYGLIRFGSRCDVYLPKGVTPRVAVGQTVIAGESILADLASDEAACQVEVI